VTKERISVAQTWSNIFLGVIILKGKNTPFYSVLLCVVIVMNVTPMLNKDCCAKENWNEET